MKILVNFPTTHITFLNILIVNILTLYIHLVSTRNHCFLGRVLLGSTGWVGWVFSCSIGEKLVSVNLVDQLF